MLKLAWIFYLAHAYALLLSGWLLATTVGGAAAWFANLPWQHWGTDLLEAVVYVQAPEPGSVWLALFLLQSVVGFLWLLSWAIFEIMALIYNAAVKRVEQERSASAQTSEPSVEQPMQPSSTTQFDSINDLVEDPEIQKLMQDLEKRLRA
jgi:hypothetical protein